MTPKRLTELRCPECSELSWVIDSDYRGEAIIPYNERPYACAHCRHYGPGWTITRQSPPEFLLQPHDLYPMTQEAFDCWLEILRRQFPEHSILSRVGTTFFPRLPEEVEAMRQTHARTHPVGEMTDQDGARRADPDVRTAMEWLEIMQPRDMLLFKRRNGGNLKVTFDGSTYSARCSDVETVLAEAADLDVSIVSEAIQTYLTGDTARCVRYLSRLRN